MKRTTQATIDAYNKWDLEAILAPRSDSCVYQFRPLSLKQPARNNSEYREYYATQIIPLLQDFKVRYAKHHLAESWNADGITKATVERTIIDPTERVSIVHCFCQANSAVGQYGPIEVMLMMTLDETVSDPRQVPLFPGWRLIQSSRARKSQKWTSSSIRLCCWSFCRELRLSRRLNRRGRSRSRYDELSAISDAHLLSQPSS